MRAYELIKETFCRKIYILIVHLSWLILYGAFWWLFLPRASELSEFGRFIFIWGGCFLALALSAGIFGDDISSGRICVLVTKPFWPGKLYIYRCKHFYKTGSQPGASSQSFFRIKRVRPVHPLLSLKTANVPAKSQQRREPSLPIPVRRWW